MFDNEAKVLERENNAQIDLLPDDEVLVIYSIMDNMGIFRVNSFDAQVIRRDLIGMVKDAKLRKSNITDIIGDDINAFTNDIIKSSRGPSKHEIVLSYLRLVAGAMFLFMGVGGLLRFSSFSWHISFVGILAYLENITSYFFIAKLVKPLLSVKRGWKIFGWYLYIGALGGLMGGPSVMFEGQYFANAKVLVHGGYVLIIAGISYILLAYLYKKTIGELAKDQSNCFDDLKN